jgi:hypothetical protein
VVAGASSATALARRFGSARSLVASVLGTAPFGLLIPLATPGPGLALAAAGGFLIAAGVGVSNVLRGSFRQTYTPHGLLGRVTVSMQLVNYGITPLGALLAGALGTTLGLRPTMWIMMSGLVLAGPILLIGPLGRRRDLPDQPAARADATSAV